MAETLTHPSAPLVARRATAAGRDAAGLGRAGAPPAVAGGGRGPGLSLAAPRWHGAAKRALDVALAVGLIVALAPLLAALALAARADGGPALYGHRRVGRGGAVFRCLKFRSMVLDSDRVLRDLLERDPQAARDWATARKLRRDPRVTPLGRVLRATSLDELPQVFNVLRGEMSFVGPRPVVQEELERHYGAAAVEYTAVRPGITGLWQISGRSDTDYARRVELDRRYVREFSFWRDLAILAKTVPCVLARRGAY